jgi:hypothetical protein
MNSTNYTSTMYRGVTQVGMSVFSAGSFYAEELSGAEGYARGGEVHEIEPKRALSLVVIDGDFDIDEIWDNATSEMIEQYDGAICGFGSGQIVLFGAMATSGEFTKASAQDCMNEFAAAYRRRDY